MINLSTKIINLCTAQLRECDQSYAWIKEGLCVVEKVESTPDELLNFKVSDLVDENGKWNWIMLQEWMPPYLLNRLTSILPPVAPNGKDKPVIAGAGTDGDLKKSDEINWLEFWANVCYNLWTWRNKEKYDVNFLRPLQPVSVPPRVGWIKMNTNELVREHTQLVVADCVLLGDYRAVELEVDSTSVVKVIRSSVTTSVMGVALVDSIGRLLEFDWEVTLTHSYRSANTCANALTNIGCTLGTDITFFEECPSQISHLLSADQMWLLSPRLISM
ncbi:hypothetical protein TSUD_139330 [Trifolium subterraneum]|uniref:RNase H type-1 domain-containing protein n=1 Tax=Trifolium subterraneum TaxID=3900 RepID=A0A2Z6P519_TRISU|nr:hypothetical protein TSUD_139330 [Trifolium subterraneum]